MGREDQSLDLVGGLPLPNCPFAQSRIILGNATVREPLAGEVGEGGGVDPILGTKGATVTTAPWLVLGNPTISLTQLFLAGGCGVAALVILARFNAVKVLNRRIHDPSVRHGWWAAFFAVLSACFLMDFLRYANDTPNARAHAPVSPAEAGLAGPAATTAISSGSIVQPYVIDAWLQLMIALGRGLSVLLLTLALHHHHRWRSRGADGPAASARLVSPTRHRPLSPPGRYPMPLGSPSRASPRSQRATRTPSGTPVRVDVRARPSPTRITPLVPRQLPLFFLEPESFILLGRRFRRPLLRRLALGAPADPEAAEERTPLLSSPGTKSAALRLHSDDGEEHAEVDTVEISIDGSMVDLVRAGNRFSGPPSVPGALAASVSSALSSAPTATPPPLSHEEHGAPELAGGALSWSDDSDVGGSGTSEDGRASWPGDGAPPGPWHFFTNLLDRAQLVFLGLWALRVVALLLLVNPPTWPVPELVPPVLVDGAMPHSPLLFALHVLASALQYGPVFLVAARILWQEHGLPHWSFAAPRASGSIRGIHSPHREDGTGTMTLSATSQVYLALGLLLHLVWMVEPSVSSRLLISLVKWALGVSSAHAYGYQSHMCVVAPWFWIEHDPARFSLPRMLDTGAGVYANAAGMVERASFHVIGWASWVDVLQWLGLASLVLLFLFVRREFLHVKQEWTHKIVTGLRGIFDL